MCVCVGGYTEKRFERFKRFKTGVLRTEPLSGIGWVNRRTMDYTNQMNMLPDAIKEQDLNGYGFILENDRKAKHLRFDSYRWKCDGCGRFFKQTQQRLCRSCGRQKD